MKQQIVNALIFGFLGVVLSLLLAAFSGYSQPDEIGLAVLVGAGLGVLIGRAWSPSGTHHRVS